MTLERDMGLENPAPPIAAAITAGDEAFKQALESHRCYMPLMARIIALDWGPPTGWVWISTGPQAIPIEHRVAVAARLRDLADLLDKTVKEDAQ